MTRCVLLCATLALFSCQRQHSAAVCAEPSVEVVSPRSSQSFHSNFKEDGLEFDNVGIRFKAQLHGPQVANSSVRMSMHCLLYTSEHPGGTSKCFEHSARGCSGNKKLRQEGECVAEVRLPRSWTAELEDCCTFVARLLAPTGEVNSAELGSFVVAV